MEEKKMMSLMKKGHKGDHKHIAFKEKRSQIGQNNQYYRDESGKWIKCNEQKIQQLHSLWITSKRAMMQHRDNEGFTVFEFKATN